MYRRQKIMWQSWVGWMREVHWECDDIRNENREGEKPASRFNSGRI